MRLSVLESGHRWPQKLFLRLILTIRGWVPDIVRMFAYRPKFFGRRFLRATRDSMRGRSGWSVGDRELMAAFTSRQNECRYCVDAHSTTASLATGLPDVIDAALEDPSTAPISEQLRAVLPFLGKLTLAPSQVGPDDLKPLRDVGLSDEEIADAIYVCALFCIINRMADALDFALEDERQRRQHAMVLLRFNYRGP
jgi:uncharacterized peroxidase-related enzyme